MFSDLTRSSYDASAKRYAEQVSALQRLQELEKFAFALPPEAAILDLGCGPGFDAKVFSEMGLVVTGIDASAKMIEIAKRYAPHAHFIVADILDLPFSNAAFDGVWANHSLLHISKSGLPAVLSQIYQLLKAGGIFYLSIKQGSGEGIEEDARYGGIEKFWSYWETEAYIIQPACDYHTIPPSRFLQKSN